MPRGKRSHLTESVHRLTATGRLHHRALLFVILAVLVLSPRPSAAADTPLWWPQYGYDEQHTGVNSSESLITPANVHSLKRLYSVPLVSSRTPSVADGAPAFLGGVLVGGETKDLLFLTTKDGWTLALDAHTGTQVWGRQYGPNGCIINHNAVRNEICYTTSSPAIDPNRHFVYSYGLDGYVHKFDVAGGIETHDAHWPELVTLKPFNEKGSSALSTATDRAGNSYLYVATAGYPGDEGDYQGHLTTINLATGAQHVFNTLCSNATDGADTGAVHFALTPSTPDCHETQSAIWSRPAVIHDLATDLIYVTTGNGSFDSAKHHWGDSVLALNPDGTGVHGDPLDSYTPTDQAELQATDADLGSTAPIILPTVAGSSYPHLAVQGQKINRSTGAGEVRLINLDNLSQSATRGPGHIGGDIGDRFKLPQGGFFMTQPAVWSDPADPGRPWVFLANENGIVGLQIYMDAGKTAPTFHVGWQPVSGGRPSPIVANGIIFYLSVDGIQALTARDGIQQWADTTVSNFHWESPIVANGTLYAADETGHLTAYGLNPSATPTVRFTARRNGKTIAFRWTVSSTSGVKSFQLYAGQRPVNGKIIRPHKSHTYSSTTRWATGKAIPALTLRVAMRDGRQFSVRAPL